VIGRGGGARDPSPAAAYMRIVSKCYSATNAVALVVALIVARPEAVVPFARGHERLIAAIVAFATLAFARWGRGHAAYGRLGLAGAVGLVVIAVASVAIAYWKVRGLA